MPHARLVCLIALSLLAAAPVPDLQLPVRPACVSSPFGPRHAVGPRAPAAFHNGIDLPARVGAPVYAVAAGTIVTIHRRGPGGLEVAVRAGDQLMLYAHLGSVAPGLAEGQSRVAAGDRIGVVGRSGITYGSHLYFEIRENGFPIDPAPLLGVTACPPPNG